MLYTYTHTRKCIHRFIYSLQSPLSVAPVSMHLGLAIYNLLGNLLQEKTDTPSPKKHWLFFI